MLLVALRLGLTSFGGPVAHIGYFRDEYVRRRRWVSDEEFAELVAVTSFLPGPSSSQLGMAIGSLRAGLRGGLAAWVGFTLPSALVMTALGLGVAGTSLLDSGLVHGLELVTAAVVLVAVVGMRRTLAPDAPRLAVAVAALATSVAVGGARGQGLALALGGCIGLLAFRDGEAPPELELSFPVSRRAAWACLGTFGGLLLAVPALAQLTGSNLLAFVAAFYRAGALVFGGGHVVLPLLEGALVDSGRLSQQAFLAGYGAAQALPGPLFSFAAYAGAAADPTPNGVAGAALALAAIFLPGMLVLAGALPLWSALRRRPAVHAAVSGIGAAVVGVLAAALWDPVLRTAVGGAADVVLVGALVLLLRVLPVWAVVAVGGAVGALVL